MRPPENDNQLKIWEKRFPQYTTNLCHIERQFYRSFDPSWYLRALQQMEAPSDGDWLDRYSDTSEEHERYELVSDETEFDTFRATFSRMLRYMSSESLLVLLASGYPFGPTPAVAVRLRNRALTELVEKIAQREVPNTRDYSPFSVSGSFDEWFGYMLFRESNPPDELKSYVDFAVGEANFIKDRSAINAYKHSRMLRPVEGQPARIRTEDGVDLLPEISSALHWTELAIKLVPGQRQEQSTISFEELNFENDCKAILSAAALMTLLQQVRLGWHEDTKELSVTLPLINMAKSHPFRIRLTETANYREGERN
ncbi:hypothetical protein Q5Y75_00115 [Ruegeria sp. 2205SS24-7]|uniref:hypothetical protein n=1 Tax=Ruegeria discodermiae TaxID=3064389 RepID=UPI002741A360|nr:hypothetical protein [Ruegeria sp. 2205SS24-7]MDP5215611.1 hypothetical protein [Ruegeria sp. 2205SS24-7]